MPDLTLVVDEGLRAHTFVDQGHGVVVRLERFETMVAAAKKLEGKL